MTGVDDDRQLRTAFRVFADSTTPYIRPPGAALALHDARRRVRTRRLAAAVAAAIVILIPAGVVAVVRGVGSTSLPVPPATSTPTLSTPPTPTASPSAAPTPTSTATPEAQPTRGPGQLLDTTLTLSWANALADETCGGPVTIVDGHSGLIVQSTMGFDVDRDGDREIVAHVLCVVGQAGPGQLLVIRLDPTGPTIVGTVLETDWPGESGDPSQRGPATIRGYVGLSDGSIRVDVAHTFTCCGIPSQAAVVQQRTYRWIGSSFAQVAGPTTFVADRALADIEVDVSTLVFSAPVDGYRTGTLTVRVHNNGPQPAADVSVYLEHYFGIEEPAGGDWGRCTSPSSRGTTSAVCALGSLAPGQSVILTLPMRRSFEQEAGESPALSDYTGRVEARAGAFYYTPSAEYAVDVA